MKYVIGKRKLGMYLAIGLWLLCFGIIETKSQAIEGVIMYEQKVDWARIYARLDYLSQEQKDRILLTWRQQSLEKYNMKLTFNATQSYYTHETGQGQTDDGRYSWKLPTYLATRDFENNTQSDWLEMLGRLYLVDDSLQLPKWKVLNKIKDIGGYVCMLAETEDTLRHLKVHAWFADGIPAPVGPGDYIGLPGAILELDINDGDIVVSAVNITLGPVSKEELTPAKQRKAKKISVEERDRLIYKHITDSIRARRSPYGSIPFL
jgi:GLPGLI family protein